MSQPAITASAPAPFLRRAFDWWLAQVKHALPPTIFFFVGFNLILWTKRLILEEHGVEFSGFLTATLAALLVGKAVLVTDNLPFMRRFDGAPMIQPSCLRQCDVLAVRNDRCSDGGMRTGAGQRPGRLLRCPSPKAERSWSRAFLPPEITSSSWCIQIALA